MPSKANDPNFKGLRQKLEPENKGSYFHVMLNMADDDLTAYEYRLLGHYVRVGECWEGTRTTAKKTYMSVGMVSKTRESLAAKGYISIEYRDNNESCLITVKDRMSENVARYSKRSSGEHSVHVVNTGVHTVNTSVHVVNERITNEEEHTKKNQKEKEHSAVTSAAIIDTWLKCQHAVKPNAFKVKQNHEIARNLIERGVSVEDIIGYVRWRRSDDFWNKFLSLEHIAENIIVWKRTSTPPAPIEPPAPEDESDYVDIPEGFFERILK